MKIPFIAKNVFFYFFMPLKFRYIEGKEGKEKNRIQPISLHQFPFVFFFLFKSNIAEIFVLSVIHMSQGFWKKEIEKKLQILHNNA